MMGGKGGAPPPEAPPPGGEPPAGPAPGAPMPGQDPGAGPLMTTVDPNAPMLQDPVGMAPPQLGGLQLVNLEDFQFLYP